MYVYARVLLDLSKGREDSITAEIHAMRGVFGEDDVCRFFSSPIVPVEDKLAVIRDVCGVCQLSDIVVNFVCVAVADGVSAALCGVFEEFFVLLRRKHGRFRLEITTASPISGKEEKRVLSVVQSKFGRPEEITMRVDPEILGGFIARGDSFVIDASYVGQLRELNKVSREAIIGI